MTIYFAMTGMYILLGIYVYESPEGQEPTVASMKQSLAQNPSHSGLKEY